MEKLIDFISASLANLFIVAGLIFLGISVVGNISGKIQPGKVGRILSGLLGLAFLGVGIKMNFTAPLAATPAPPIDIASQSTIIPLPANTIAVPTSTQLSQNSLVAPTPVPIDTPTNTPSPTPSSKWGTWEALGGDLVEAPAVSSWGNGRLDVFVRGTDDQLWHMYYWNGPDWSGWEPLGGSITSSPAAVSWGPDRIDIFARGGDGHLWHMSWNNGWTGWEPLGGDLVGAPAVSSWANGRLDVFVRGTDDQLWHMSGDGSSWSGWEDLEGSLTSAPAAVSWGPDHIDMLARGGDGHVWHNWWEE